MKSMRLFLLLAFNALMLLEASGFNHETDRQALLEFKSQVSEEKRVVLSSWNHSFPLCNWKGVTCGNKHKRVTCLDLGGLKLGGVITPSIGNLSFLISLNLSDNSFGGTIPQEVGNLFRLEDLYMSFNFLGGLLPASLSNCSRLLALDLFSNHLGGGVPSELGSLAKLVALDLSNNKLKGKLPASLGNLTSLQQVGLAYNNLQGDFPNEIARLSQMVTLELSVNNFSGVFPPAIYNLTSLEYLYIHSSGFSGSLRHDLGDLLPNIRELAMSENYLTGDIPTTLPNISTLEMFGIGKNKMTGSISPNFGKLQNLHYLELALNSLGSYSFGDLEFLDALTNCTHLHILSVAYNRLGGALPTSIANMSTNLMGLNLGGNLISGSIPHSIGNLLGLQSLLLEENILTGPLPTSLGKLLGLEFLSLYSNKMSGGIPSFIGNLTRLGRLYLSNNSFQGLVPLNLGNCSHMLDLRIGYNRLHGTIPREVMQISTLVTLTMERNSLTGTLPQDVGRLEYLTELSVWGNKLSGKMPQTLGNCLSMEELYLQENSFDGGIPDIRRLVGVKRVDLSNNNLSGSIPEYLANFSSLEYLNLSVNNFEGKVPTEEKFRNATIVSVFGNKDLCGGIKELQLKPCFAQAPLTKTKHSSLLKKVVIWVSIGVALLLLLFVASFYLCWLRKRKKNHQTSNQAPSSLEVFHEKISYGDVRDATDGFSSRNMVGSGSFGNVFKAFLPTENKVVAVKVLNLQRHGAMKSFMAECESLKDIRSDDVASVLDYLHVHCHEPIAHCDLKPSNVLLDNDLTAHVSDFGLARLLLKLTKSPFFNQLSSAGVRGTIGYAAPEYGMGGKPSIHGDVYSFGVLLLEMFTGKRPTNELFGGSCTLHSYTKSALPEKVLDIADQSILHSGLRVGFPVAECLTLFWRWGLGVVKNLRRTGWQRVKPQRS
ncbi:unnamed protein product [Microthlaspi erraticum]|uniref:non-specific serine/threonine protein kinase n=1 Tax=Microthlaspi erraticum TaxID=1685480 RepID=A0A6D2IRZ7_9BRAS|nr:unnamed protein product [Microthlaspi erraticum]